MKYFHQFLQTVVTVCALKISVMPAAAITIDKFEGGQEVNAPVAGQVPANVTQSSLVNANAVGGIRKILASVPQGSPTRLQVRTDNMFKHSQDANVVGRSVTSWDGTSVPDIYFPPANPSSFLVGTPSGLNGLDLLGDNSTAFRLKIVSFDYPSNKPITITIAVYDAANPLGDKYSQASVTLTRPYANEDLDIPFANFNLVPAPGSVGFADFTNVGAISMIVDGSNPDVDLTLEQFGTDGECDHVPVNGLIKDQCNVCNGDNSSCSDCLGVPNGNTVAGTNCTTGDPGVCTDGTYSGKFPTCECKSNTPPSTEICDQKDNDCDGQIDENLFDACGICGGDGKSCADCAGTPFGTATVDACGICGGDGKSCADCAGTPNGTAKLDRCNVCNGDGTSCLSCEDIDISPLQFLIDHGAKLQEKIIKDLLKKLTSRDKSKATAAYAKATAAQAHELQLRNWTISWIPPSQQRVCGNTAFCTQISIQSLLDEYRTHNDELRDIGRKVITKLKKLRFKTTPLSAKNEAQYKSNVDNVNKIPTTHSSGC